MTRQPPDKIPLIWQTTGNGEFPYQTAHEGRQLTIRINDFPEYPTVFSLLIDGQWAKDIEHLPKYWIIPDKSA